MGPPSQIHCIRKMIYFRPRRRLVYFSGEWGRSSLAADQVLGTSQQHGLLKPGVSSIERDP